MLLADSILPSLEENGVQRDFYKTETEIQHSDFTCKNVGRKIFLGVMRLLVYIFIALILNSLSFYAH